jgi:Protein of unknown function (DUF2799)
MRRAFALALGAGGLAGCATVYEPGPGNLAQYCAPDNAFRLGSESRAYLGGCPKGTEAAFLDALERGRALRPNTPSVYPYIEQMRETEKMLLAAGSDAERERIRARLRDLEWWAVHLMNSPGSYGEGP